MPDADSLTDAYAARLQRLAQPAWKRVLNVQAPYRWNLRRLKPGRILDIGCGLGRNLGHVDGHGVGVDANPACVEAARAAGFAAYTPEGFAASADAQAAYDTLLMAHVVEHMGFDQAAGLLRAYLPYLKPDGRVVLITPQELGYRTDATHVEFFDFAKLRRLAEAAGLRVERDYSFPFPRLAGRLFPYNEFVLVARR
jgi:2-polyprenyl-3-methyl-5-hydroxy-6-metoxy-1,4-benzoquinol methylase